MKISTRIAAIGASAFLAMSAFSAPAIAAEEDPSAFECGALELFLKAQGLPEENMRNTELSDALEEKGYNAKTASNTADTAEDCGLVKPDTIFTNISSTFAGLSS